MRRAAKVLGVALWAVAIILLAQGFRTYEAMAAVVGSVYYGPAVVVVQAPRRYRVFNFTCQVEPR